jgi:hypothetical protein
MLLGALSLWPGMTVPQDASQGRADAASVHLRNRRRFHSDSRDLVIRSVEAGDGCFGGCRIPALWSASSTISSGNAVRKQD